MQVTANGTMLEAKRLGPKTGTPLVLIRGLGSQLIHWPEEFLTDLTAADFDLILFDNRDAGLSEKFAGRPAYTLSDMAADTVGLLDALGLPQAHMLGLSMGGMILQAVALRHPGRLLSGIAIMSSSLAPGLPEAAPHVREALQSRAQTNTREDVIAHTLQTGRLWQSPGWPFDEATRSAQIGRAFDRCYSPDGVDRQRAAIQASAPVLARIEDIAAPMLVIHGRDDQLLPPEHGRNIAARIPGARYIEIAGMGHDLEGALPKRIAGHVIDFIRPKGD